MTEKIPIKCSWCESDLGKPFSSYSQPIIVILSGKVTEPFYFDKNECLLDWIKGITKAKEI